MKLSSTRVFCLPILLFLGVFLTSAARAQSSVAGDWQGTVAYGPGLHIGLHLSGSDDALKGTLDNIDQGVFGIALTAITFKAHTLTFTVESAHASYTGTLSSDAATLTGKMTQGDGSAALNFARVSVSSKGQDTPKSDTPPPSIDGAWSGSFNLPAGKLPIVLHFLSTGGKLTATMDSPAQGATGIAITSITRAGNTLHFAITDADATFDGSFSPDTQTLTGTWTQHGTAAPLTLTRGSAPAAAPAP